MATDVSVNVFTYNIFKDFRNTPRTGISLRLQSISGLFFGTEITAVTFHSRRYSPDINLQINSEGHTCNNKCWTPINAGCCFYLQNFYRGKNISDRDGKVTHNITLWNQQSKYLNRLNPYRNRCEVFPESVTQTGIRYHRTTNNKRRGKLRVFPEGVNIFPDNKSPSTV